MEVNGIKFNFDKVIKSDIESQNAVFESADFNYNKVHHPKELLGRTSINFTSNLPIIDETAKPLADKLKDLGLKDSSIASAVDLSNFDDDKKADVIKSRLEFCDYAALKGSITRRFGSMVKCVTPENLEFAKVLYDDKDFYFSDNLFNSSYTQDEQKDGYDSRCAIFKKLRSIPNSQDRFVIMAYIYYAQSETKDFIDKLIDSDLNLNYQDIFSIMQYDGKPEDKKEAFEAREEYFDFIMENPEIDRKKAFSFLSSVNKDNIELLKAIVKNCDMTKLGEFSIKDILRPPYMYDKNSLKAYYDAKSEVLTHILSYDTKQPYCYLSRILSVVDEYNKDFCITLLSDSDFSKSQIATTIALSGSAEKKEKTINARADFYNYITSKHPDIDSKTLGIVLPQVNPFNLDFIKTLIDDKKVEPSKIARIIQNNTSKKDIDAKAKVYEKLKALNAEKEHPHSFQKIIAQANDSNCEFSIGLLDNFLNKGLVLPQIPPLMQDKDEITLSNVQGLIRRMGVEKTQKIPSYNIVTAVQYRFLHNKKHLSELSMHEKREFFKRLVSLNSDTYSISPELKKDFPLIPTNDDEYSATLPQIISSLGIKTKPLSENENKEFYNSLNNLAKTLSRLSDKEYNSLKITQSYPLDNFIQDTFNIVKDLDPKERAKVYDYFGFELQKRGKYITDGLILQGYPSNPHDYKKQRKITSPKTQIALQKLKPVVNKYNSKDNKIESNNPEVTIALQDIINKLPELRTLIGKVQHGAHQFDLMGHSLKLLQKIVQNDDFNNLDDSDKKVIILAALMHDITKTQGRDDPKHPQNSAFDACFITQRLNLSKQEQNNLYALINTHEWLRYITIPTEDDNGNVIQNEAQKQTKLMQSLAYDLRYDNLFDMSLIFTHADLMAVKGDNDFHDKPYGSGRVKIGGISRSFGESADIYAGNKSDDVNSNTIRGYINELKKSQPILPCTEIPTTDVINKAIKKVYKDGSTNIKGVYKDNKSGLIAIKFNEVEDWERIGFPKGSISKGIIAQAKTEAGMQQCNTGNIKFFVHGLGGGQRNLIKFDAFSLIDSDALLSVSYTERPESKYAFFRKRGIILSTDTQNIHGGGDSDSGSGCKKNLEKFKNFYIFDGPRISDRLFISKLIKDELQLTDDEYIELVKENKNKALDEIVPQELAYKLVQALAKINSRERHQGDPRAYNEMYITNPRVMGVYISEPEGIIGNPIEYLKNKQTKENKMNSYDKNLAFTIDTITLQNYAIKNSLPMIVFGE